MFGAVNSLFSGIAFAGVILTIWLQRQELSDTRFELKRSAEAQERQLRLLPLTAEVTAPGTLAAHRTDMSSSTSQRDVNDLDELNAALKFDASYT